MADHKSSKKRIIRNNKRNEINSTRIAELEHLLKKLKMKSVQIIKTRLVRLLM